MEDNIQLIINTLQTLNVQPTIDNMRALLGCIELLNRIREEQQKKDERIQELEKASGTVATITPINEKERADHE